MKLIKISNVEIDIHHGPIGISCSGGADSSLLLYVLLQHSTDPIHVFTCTSEFKNYASVVTTTSVIKKCIELTKNNNIFHHVQYVKKQSIENLFYKTQFDAINILYTGITSNPPLDVQHTFKTRSEENHERDPTKVRSLYSLVNKIYTPFTNIDKQKVAQMYTELNLTDSLFPVTRSCESLTLTEGHCGECWWCEERKWGFGRLT